MDDDAKPAPDGTGRTGPAAEAEDEYIELNDGEWTDERLPNTFPTGPTIDADRRDAVAAHEADAIDPVAAEAAPTGPVDDAVREAEAASTARGAHVRGEGQI